MFCGIQGLGVLISFNIPCMFLIDEVLEHTYGLLKKGKPLFKVGSVLLYLSCTFKQG